MKEKYFIYFCDCIDNNAPCVRYGFFWAILVALVDAVPVLGTGTVLIPWAVVCLLRQELVRGVLREVTGRG